MTPTEGLKPPIVGQDPSDPTHQDPVLDQGVLSSAQVPGSPNHDSVYASDIPAWVQLTEAIYWASKPQAVQDLRKLAGLPPNNQPGQNPAEFTPRYEAAMKLSTQGYVIDVPIDAFGDNPIIDMLLRQEMGISAISAGNGTSVIVTSLNPADYKPFYPPVKATPARVVGMSQGFIPSLGGNIFSAGPGALAAAGAGVIVDGGQYTQDGIQYKVHITAGLFGETIWFSL